MPRPTDPTPMTGDDIGDGHDNDPLDVAGIRTAAEKATPGPWRRSAPTPWGTEVIFNEAGEFYLGVSAKTGVPNDGWSQGARQRASELGKAKRADAHYIATMDPQTTLALLDALAAGHAEIERLTADDARWRENVALLCEGIGVLLAEREGIAAEVLAPEGVADDEKRDVAAWLIREADQRVKFFPQRRDGIDALMRHLAAALSTAKEADHG